MSLIKINQETLDKKLQEEQIQKEAKARQEAMLKGKDYQGYQISFTKDDGDGLVQVKSGFELGLMETIVYFENGIKMPITNNKFPEFALWFMTERNKFFTEV